MGLDGIHGSTRGLGAWQATGTCHFFPFGFDPVSDEFSDFYLFYVYWFWALYKVAACNGWLDNLLAPLM